MITDPVRKMKKLMTVRLSSHNSSLSSATGIVRVDNASRFIVSFELQALLAPAVFCSIVDEVVVVASSAPKTPIDDLEESRKVKFKASAKVAVDHGDLLSSNEKLLELFDHQKGTMASEASIACVEKTRVRKMLGAADALHSLEASVVFVGHVPSLLVLIALALEFLFALSAPKTLAVHNLAKEVVHTTASKE
jgi:hypothetical protein